MDHADARIDYLFCWSTLMASKPKRSPLGTEQRPVVSELTLLARPLDMFRPPGFFVALQQQPTSIHVSHVAGRLCFPQHDRPVVGRSQLGGRPMIAINNERNETTLAIKLRRHAPRDRAKTPPRLLSSGSRGT